MRYTIGVQVPGIIMPSVECSGTELRGVVAAIPDHADVWIYRAHSLAGGGVDTSALVSSGKQPLVYQEIKDAVRTGRWHGEGVNFPL